MTNMGVYIDVLTFHAVERTFTWLASPTMLRGGGRAKGYWNDDGLTGDYIGNTNKSFGARPALFTAAS